MSGSRTAPVRTALIGLVALAAAVLSAAAQETVAISVPPAVNFPVTDVSRSTSGMPGVTTITFSNATLGSGKALRVSVQADAAAFTAPGGPSIPVSSVAWVSVGASGGIGWSGTLSASFPALVFQSSPATPSGHVDLEWTMAPPPSGIRAGSHQVTIRWKLESITP